MISAPATRGEYMAEQQIAPGTKLQVAFDVPMGQKTDFNMLATYKEDLDEAYFLMSAPMLAGKPLLMDENQKLLLQYKVGEETFVLAGYPESVEKKGIRTYWKMRKVAEQRTFVRRRDERFKVAMRLTYQRDNAPTPEPEDAMTIDVSAGGLAIYLNDYPDVGEALAVQMPTIRLQGERHELPGRWASCVGCAARPRAVCTATSAACSSVTPTTWSASSSKNTSATFAPNIRSDRHGSVQA